MKRYSKFIATTMAALTIATGIAGAATMAVGGVSKVNYNFVINENKITLPNNYLVMSKNGTTYVPLRFISETLGAKVDYSQGRISINTQPTTTLPQPEDTKRIKELESELEKLKKENGELDSRLKAINQSMNYKSLPTVQSSINDLNIKLLQISQSGEDLSFTVEFINKSKERHFIVDPFKTKVFVDGKEYKATLATDAALNSTMNTQDSKLYGEIIIGGINNTKIKGSVVFYFMDNGISDNITLYFDNSK